MSSRDVSCYINNLTGEQFNVSGQNVWDGSDSGGLSPQPINPGDSGTQIFHFSKSGAFSGVTGTVSYVLTDGSILQLSFNCPYSQDGDEGPSNCFFYAGITNVPSGGTQYYVQECSVSIDGNPMNATYPATGDTVSATVTIGPSNS